METLLEEVRNEEAINFSFRKEMTDIESQLKQQQNLYQAVRNDKSVLQRSLREANDAISDLKVSNDFYFFILLIHKYLTLHCHQYNYRESFVY